MESKEFKFLMYSIALGNWEHALNMIDNLEKEVDPNKLPILTDIKNAIVARKNDDYGVAKKLWKEIQLTGENLNDQMGDFAKAIYYDTLADSNEKQRKKYLLKVKEYYEKIGDSILILIAEATISKKPEKDAELYKKVAEELTKAGDTEDMHSANAMYYMSLTNTTDKSEEKAELFKKAAEELTKAGEGETKEFHNICALYHGYLAYATEKPEEKAELYKKVAEEFTKAGDTEHAHAANAMYYRSMAEATDKSEEKAGLYKKAAEELKEAGKTEEFHQVFGLYYESLAYASEKPEEKVRLYKKAAEESIKGGNAEHTHLVNALYFLSLIKATDKPEKKVELYKKTAEELKEAGKKKTKNVDSIRGLYYLTLAKATEKPEEKAGLYKKAAEEWTKAGHEEHAHSANAMYYASLAEATEKPEEKAELYKKAAEELKEAEDKENAHKLMAKYYFFLSLSTKSKADSERYQLLASGETKLGWLYLTQIAFNESKKSKTIDTSLLELTIELYKKYLQYKNRQFPVSSIYLCGDITGSTKQIMADFKFNMTSFPRGRFKNTPEFKEEVKKNDFVLMELNKDIDDELLYELGLMAGMEKPILVLKSENINSFNKFIPKIATVISNRKNAFTVLKLFSVIKSGESLAIEDKTEKSAIDELMRGFKEKPLFISQLEFDKTRLIGRYRGKS